MPPEEVPTRAVEFSPKARGEWEALLARYPARRAALIPTLHLAEREFGVISREVEEYVALLIDIPLAAVHEVVTFYSLLPRRPRGERHLRVCQDLSCHLRGCERVIARIQERLGIPPGETTPDGKWSWERSSCLGSCEVAPMMQVGEDYVGPLDPDGMDRLLDDIEAGRTPGASCVVRDVPHAIVSRSFGKEEARRIETYRESGGYRSLEKALRKMTPEAVREIVATSRLRGLGGAGFPAGIKWGFIPAKPSKPVYLVVNADEGEPGTFKDRYCLEWDPHRLIEGIGIAAYAVGARRVFIYIRGEYRRPAKRLETALEEARKAGFIGKGVLGTSCDIEPVIHRGAGAYICGEETALLESLEGKKGWPRLKPPYPVGFGAFGCPTVVNNVETLAYLPEVLRRGPAAFAGLAQGRPASGGLRTFSLSGRVARPGPYELPLGTPLRDLIFGHGGGILDGAELKAVIPGGTSSPLLSADEIDLPLDFDALDEAGSSGGSGAVIVLDDRTCIVETARVLARFYAHESCGQCTPCREGSGWLERILGRILDGGGVDSDLETLVRITHSMVGTSICPLARADAVPVRRCIEKFRSEFEHHIREGSCDVRAIGAGR